MDSLVRIEREPPPLLPVVPVEARGYKAELPDIAFHPARALWRQLQDPEGWQNICLLPTYVQWAQALFMEHRIAEAHAKGIDPQTIRDFDRDVFVINQAIGGGVARQSQADKIAYEVRRLLGVNE